jgi:hypothetical protein
MATSGTSAFNLDLTEILDEAAERCNYELRSGHDFKTARRSLNLLFADWSNQGLHMFTFEQLNIPLVPGTTTYDLPVDTVDIMDAVIRTGTGTNQSDLVISRIALPTYQSIPNKNNTGRPLQMFIQRYTEPKVSFWPVPDTSIPYTFVYWRLRRIQDAGTGVNTQDMPFRFVPAMVAGLAYYLSMKLPGGLERMGMLKAMYDETMQNAIEEDREKAPMRLVPYIGFR